MNHDKIKVRVIKDVLSKLDRSDLEKYALHAIGALMSVSTERMVDATILAHTLDQQENDELERVSLLVAQETKKQFDRIMSDLN